jgi:predicted nucleic-acid-binding protein
MIGVDTNVLLRWLVDETLWPVDNPEQVELARRALSDPANRFFIGCVVLAETIWVLGKPLQQPKAVFVEALGRLLGASNLVIDARAAGADAVASFSAGSGGFSDHLIGELNRHGGCRTTFTFDKKAGRAATFTRFHASSKPGG